MFGFSILFDMNTSMCVEVLSSSLSVEIVCVEDYAMKSS